MNLGPQPQLPTPDSQALPTPNSQFSSPPLAGLRRPAWELVIGSAWVGSPHVPSCRLSPARSQTSIITALRSVSQMPPTCGMRAQRQAPLIAQATPGSGSHREQTAINSSWRSTHRPNARAPVAPFVRRRHEFGVGRRRCGATQTRRKSRDSTPGPGAWPPGDAAEGNGIREEEVAEAGGEQSGAGPRECAAAARPWRPPAGL